VPFSFFANTVDMCKLLRRERDTNVALSKVPSFVTSTCL